MTLWVCAECSTAYAVGLGACPHCWSKNREDEDMQKISVHGGPSDKDAEPGQYEDPADQAEPETGPAKVDHSEKPPAVLHEDWTVLDLRSELKRRGLPVYGSKDELLKRLEKDQRG
jgi:hypothetical protein